MISDLFKPLNVLIKKNISRVVLLLFFIITFPVVWASESEVLISYQIDKVPSLSIDQIYQAEIDKDFLPFFGEAVNFGWIGRPVWIRAQVPEQTRSVYLQLSADSIDKVEVFSGKTGEKPVSKPERIQSSQYEFRDVLVELPGGTVNYIRLKSHNHLFLNYTLFKKDNYLSQLGNRYLLIGLFLGFIVSFTVYILLGYSTFKDVNYLYFLGIVVSTALYFAVVTGVGGVFFQLALKEHLQILSQICSTLLIVSCLLFIRHFLKTQENHAHVDFVIKILFTLTGLHLLATPFIESVVTYKLGRYLEIAIPAIILYFSINSYIQGYKEARFMVLGWGIYFAAYVLTAFMYAGILPISFMTSNALAFGALAVIISMAWALMDRFEIQYEANFALHSKEGAKLTQQAEKSLTELLVRQEEVAVLQAQMKEKDREIDYLNHRLKEQMTHDSLTKLMNYNTFMQSFYRLFHDATRYHYIFSVLLIEIDKFDEIEKKSGEASAQDVLKSVCNLLLSNSRNTDLLAKYNEEAFIFVLSHAVLKNTQIKAQSLLQQINSITIPVMPEFIVTASMGLTVMGASERNSDSQFILEKAERALADAKKNGGNRLSVFVYDEKHLER